MSRWFFTLSFIANLLISHHGFANTFKIDQDHTTVSFKVRHLFSWTHGRFNQFEGEFIYDDKNPETWRVKALIDAESVDTNVEERDEHLRGKDFFDVKKFPEIIFKSSGVEQVSQGGMKLRGMLTIHGVERLVELDVMIHGSGRDPWGNTLASFTATTVINRKDFGLTWNKVAESGGVLVGDEVMITIDVEGVLQE